MTHTKVANKRAHSHVFAAVASLMLAAFVVVQASSAAFTDTTSNDGNFFNAAAIELVDNDQTEVMYEVEGMVPGQSEERCIQVQYTATGDTPPDADVRLYVSAIGVADLAPALNINVDVDTTSNPALAGASEDFDCTTLGFGTANASFTGSTIADFATANNNFDSGVLNQTIENDDVFVYRFTVDFEDDVDNIAGVTDLNTLQGEQANGINFTWEAVTN